MNAQFSDWNRSHYTHPLRINNLHAMVLTTGSWPIDTPSGPLPLPDELQCFVERFTTFYGSITTGRRLHWALDLSIGTLSTNCYKRRYEFHVSTRQMVILFLVISIFLQKKLSVFTL